MKLQICEPRLAGSTKMPMPIRGAIITEGGALTREPLVLYRPPPRSIKNLRVHTSLGYRIRLVQNFMNIPNPGWKSVNRTSCGQSGLRYMKICRKRHVLWLGMVHWLAVDHISH